jgi:hypothetical protein
MAHPPHITGQLNLFELRSSTPDVDRLVLYALGEFQARGKHLAGRELALDRLRGAFRRASERLSVTEPSDNEIAKSLEHLGAAVRAVPTFVAKHPFKIVISDELADFARSAYQALLTDD